MFFTFIEQIITKREIIKIFENAKEFPYYQK